MISTARVIDFFILLNHKRDMGVLPRQIVLVGPQYAGLKRVCIEFKDGTQLTLSQHYVYLKAVHNQTLYQKHLSTWEQHEKEFSHSSSEPMDWGHVTHRHGFKTTFPHLYDTRHRSTNRKHKLFVGDFAQTQMTYISSLLVWGILSMRAQLTKERRNEL